MQKIRTIPVERLTVDAAEKFGKVLAFGDRQASSRGDWWQCWEGCAELSAGRQWVGFVEAAAGMPAISEMEREPGTEMIIPVQGTIVQVVALGGPDGKSGICPDARTARAFIIARGEALVMAPGVWHAAAFGLNDKAAYFYVAERRRAEQSEGRLGWVEIAGGEVLQLIPSGPPNARRET
jgi:ureidoglycolate hydrolase